MSTSVELLSGERDRVGLRWTRRTRPVTGRALPVPTRLWRYLPLAALTTITVIVLPAVLVAAIVPRGGLLLAAAAAASAVALSIAVASVAAAVWKRQPRSRDLLFADLMLWGWLRRCWTERRLSQARELFDSARKAGPSVNIQLLTGLSRVLEGRDAYTHGHSQRVAGNAVRIAHAMHLSEVEIAKIHAAAAVHDVGKLFIPREILNNPAPLTDEEFAVIKHHAVEGAEMLAAVGDSEIASIVRHHHERIDGRGYPDGLAGAKIPLGARIIAVADTFDAITSGRAYRPAARQKRALDILSSQAGSQLDPDVVAVFLHRYSARRSVAWLSLATAAAQRIPAGLQSASSSLGANIGGLTSILPALGAAGLLAVSPGLRHRTFADRSTTLQPTLTGSHRPAIAPGLATPAPRGDSRQTPKARTAPSGHSRGQSTPATPTSTPASGPSAAGTPATASPTHPTSPAEPVVSGPASPPKVSTPIPTPPTSPLPVGGAPSVPSLPALPASPPVSVPGVSPPSVKVPNVGVPGVRTPAVEVPSVGIEGVG